MDENEFDVLIVGAGISGIGAACQLSQHCPDRRVAIVEARQDLGGTWDLFRYPGVRSDSDMHTLGFSFRPWTQPQSIAQGPSIQQYLRDTANEFGVDRLIRYGHKVLRADWSSSDARWTVQIERTADHSMLAVRCHFLFMCSGYYDYDQGYRPDFVDQHLYRGRWVHPQHWPEDLDLSGKKVIVVGSGATAITLVPALAQRAAHVTMLQRSPTWMVSRPSVDPLADRLRRRLPSRLALSLIRWKNVLMAMAVFRLCRKRPHRMRELLLRGVRHALGPEVDIATHFTPRYKPWEQRLCLVPDGDFFAALRSGRASVVTDQIQSFNESGLTLTSGASLQADVVVTATGLQLAMLGHVVLHVDGRLIDPAKTVSYKGLMYSGIPNLAHSFGYTNASWTLKADLSARYVCRLLNHMRRAGARSCMPPDVGPDMPLSPWVDFSSGYFRRAEHLLPKQGSVKPWILNQNYLKDWLAMRWGRIDDGVLRIF